MEVPQDLRYTEEHEWVRMEGDVARVGITAYAQEQLGDLVYVDLPKVGQRVRAGQACGVVESVKAASDLFSPIDGVVREANARLADEPELANRDPYGDGWMLLVEPATSDEVGQLLDAAAYETLVAEESD